VELRAKTAAIGRELPAGAQIGRYTVVRRLARGGMAEVYLARERGPVGVERLVALKVILPQMADESRFLSMFKTETRVAATLDHPNIAQVREAGEVGGEPYLAMEYVHGRTVQSLLRTASERRLSIPLGCALALVIGACAGLHYAHERRDLSGRPLGIVHRDVSPSNLMLRHDGAIKLVDFGIAKAASQTSATATGFFKGKTGYMSPEQCADEPLDRRSDVFNLGIMLYELTTDRRAFFGDNPVAVINKIANGRFTPPTRVVAGYPPELEAIVLRAMASEADDRYPTAEALQLDLEAFVRAHKLDVSSAALAALMRAAFGDEPYPSVPTTVGGVALVDTEADLESLSTTTSRRKRSSRAWVAAVGGIVLFGLGGTVAWSFGGFGDRSVAGTDVEPRGAAPPEVSSQAEPAAVPVVRDSPPENPPPNADAEPVAGAAEPIEPAAGEAEPAQDEPARSPSKRKRPRRASKVKKSAEDGRAAPPGMYP
jgi:serine/threonine-protein kinase